jgi:hypothetical protein
VFIVCRSWKTNFHFPFPLAANKQNFAVSVFRLQQTNGSCRFPLVLFYIYIFTENRTLYLYATVSSGKGKIEAKAVFLNPFTVYSSCKLKFVVCLFIEKETNRSYLFVNGLNGLKRLIGLDLPNKGQAT